MANTVRIILTGKVCAGFERDEVAATLAKMFKLSEIKADALLKDRETVVKRDVPAGIASRHIKVLQEIGAEARVESMPDPEPAVPLSAKMESAPKPPPEPDDMPATGRAAAMALELVPIAAAEPGSEPEPRPYSGSDQSASNGPVIAPHLNRAGLVPGATVLTYETPPMFGLSLNGRIGRLRFLVYGWLGIALVAVAAVLLLMVTGYSFYKTSASGSPGVLWLIAALVLGLIVLWMSIRVSVLRLHDVNLSGWFMLLWALPAFIAGLFRSPGLMTVAVIVSWLASLALVVWPGTDGENDYGDPPDKNTLLIQLGALLVVVLGVIGVLSYVRHPFPVGNQMATPNAAYGDPNITSSTTDQ